MAGGRISGRKRHFIKGFCLIIKLFCFKTPLFYSIINSFCSIINLIWFIINSFYFKSPLIWFIINLIYFKSPLICSVINSFYSIINLICFIINSFYSKSPSFCFIINSIYSKTILFCPAIQFTAVTDHRFRAARGKVFLLFQPYAANLINMTFAELADETAVLTHGWLMRKKRWAELVTGTVNCNVPPLPVTLV